MLRRPSATLRWVFLHRHPSWPGDWLSLLPIPLLLLGCGLALTWPWWSVEVPRLLWSGLTWLHGTLLAGWDRLLTLLPRFG